MLELLKAAEMMGRYAAAVERMVEDNSHTCKNAHFRYPYPWERDCVGCRKSMDEFVRRFRLQMPYLLFGWDTMIEHYLQTIKRLGDEADERVATRREIGAYI
jgi:hypothetical protein